VSSDECSSKCSCAWQVTSRECGERVNAPLSQFLETPIATAKAASIASFRDAFLPGVLLAQPTASFAS